MNSFKVALEWYWRIVGNSSWSYNRTNSRLYIRTLLNTCYIYMHTDRWYGWRCRQIWPCMQVAFAQTLESSVNIRYTYVCGWRTNRYRVVELGGCIHGCDASFFSWKMRIQPRPENSHRGLIMHPTAITDELTTIPISLFLSLPLYSSLAFADSSFFFFHRLANLASCVPILVSTIPCCG